MKEEKWGETKLKLNEPEHKVQYIDIETKTKRKHRLLSREKRQKET